MSEFEVDRRREPVSGDPGPLDPAGDNAIAESKPGPPPSRSERRAVRELRSFALSHFRQFLRLPFSRLHDDLFLRRVRKTRESLQGRRGRIDVVLAPRGAAKSTILAQILPIHALIRGDERYILIVSATHRQSKARLANIRTALRSSSSLADVCPAIGERWPLNRADCIELGGVRIEACSAGAELRGLAFGPWRPTWIILDDIEDSRRIRSPEYRDGLYDWMREVIEYLGDSFTHIDLIGTLLHRDALPVRLARRPDVHSCVYRAIIREADRQDLWHEWRLHVRDAEEPDPLEAARRFFEARREAMMAGAQVLWPEKEDYYALQLMRAHQGDAAFDKEKQNAPHFQGGGIFQVERIPRFSLIDDVIVPPGDEEGFFTTETGVFKARDLDIYGFLDPVRRAGGNDVRRDFACIATVGMHGSGRLFVLDVWLERAAPSRQVVKVFDLHARWRYCRFGVETTAFQQLLMEHLEKERSNRRARGEISDLPVQPVERRENKRWRILRLEPRVAGGAVYLADDLDETFLSQLEAFPEGAHDDGPDALEGAARLAFEGLKQKRDVIETIGPHRRGFRKF